MALRAAMVLTTVADPVVLEGYYANFAAHGHLDQIQIIVIPDQKTPPAAMLRCAELRNYFRPIAAPMRAWVAACQQVAGIASR